MTTVLDETKIVLKIGKDSQKVSYVMRFFDRWLYYTTTFPAFLLKTRTPSDLRDARTIDTDLDTIVKFLLDTPTRQNFVRYAIKKSEVVIIVRGRIHRAWWTAFVQLMHRALNTIRHTHLEVIYGSGFKETVVKKKTQSYANRPKKLRYKRR